VFATSKYRRQRATNTATAHVSFCHMNPSMDCVADVNRAEKYSRMGANGEPPPFGDAFITSSELPFRLVQDLIHIFRCQTASCLGDITILILLLSSVLDHKVERFADCSLAEGVFGLPKSQAHIQVRILESDKMSAVFPEQKICPMLLCSSTHFASV
jgi:hypothetical protein